MKILSLSGFVPEQICDTIRFINYTGDRNIPHYCGYVSDFISQVIQDETIDGAVFPKSCDSTRTISSYLSTTGKYLFQMGIPSFGTPHAKEYLASEIKSYKETIEDYFEIKLNDIIYRTELINKRNKKIRELYDNLSDISFSDYLSRIHSALVRPLYCWEKIGNAEKANGSGKKVFIIGSFLANIEIAKSIEEAGLLVVGDTLPESGRIAFSKETVLHGNIYENIAESMLSMKLSPTQNSFQTILNSDIDEIINKDVQGVIFITQKYCEPYDYLFSSYKKKVDSMGLPILKMSLNDSEDRKKALLALEAFADII